MVQSDVDSLSEQRPHEEVPNEIKRERGFGPVAVSSRRRSAAFSIVIFSFLAVLLMLLTAFYSMAEAAVLENYEPYSYVPSPSYVYDGTKNPSMDPIAKPKDFTGGGPVGYERPREISSVYTKTTPVLSTTADARREVHLEKTDSEYQYDTDFGIFVFSADDPSVIKVTNSQGSPLAQASFMIDGSPTLGPAVVSQSNDQTFITCQEVINSSAAIGELTVTTSLSSLKSPKISAQLKMPEEGAFSISWRILLESSLFKAGDQIIRPTELALTLDKQEVYGIESGAMEGGEFKSTCSVDWSDAGCGKPSFEQSGNATILTVQFPRGMTEIDPTIVAESDSSFATSGSPMRNVFYSDGTYWLFFANTGSIWFVQSADGGLNWSNPQLVMGVREEPGSFDVAVSGNRVVLCVQYGGDQNCYVETEQGYIGDKTIEWVEGGGVVGPFNLDNGDRFGGVALTDNGTTLVAVVRYFAWDVRVDTWKKGWPGDEQFVALSNRLPTWSRFQSLTEEVFPRWVALSNGSANLVVLERNQNFYGEYQSRIYWEIYSSTLSAWDAPAYWQAQMSIGPVSSFSCCPGRLNDTHMALLDRGGYLQYLHLSQTGGVFANTTNLSQPGVSWPSISVDVADGLYLQYVQDGTVFELRMSPQTATWSEEPIIMFPAQLDAPTAISSGEKFVQRDFLSYTDSSSTPKHVMFGSLPLPADTAGPYGDFWSKGGINQDQPFDLGIAESISPGNGLLNLLQTDFVVPGRAIDMTVSRMFLSPQYYVQNETGFYLPYLNEKFPFSYIDEGWQIDLPWIDEYHVHLWGGSKVAIKWEGDVFRNSVGPQFVLTRDAMSARYYLDLNDGMRVEFNYYDGRPLAVYANRLQGLPADITFFYSGHTGVKLVSMRDCLNGNIEFDYQLIGYVWRLTAVHSLQNYVRLNYTNGRLSNTTDPLGKRTTFGYDDTGNPSLPIRSVTYPTGGTCSFTYGTVYTGTEAISRVVSTKIQGNHKVIYGYKSRDGVISYCQQDDYGDGPLWRLKGSTEFQFDSKAKKSSVSYFGATTSGELYAMKRTVSWYSMNGKVSRAESYDDFRDSPDVATSVTDSKGNVVYSIDPSGHEVFSSFANSSCQNAFLRSATLSQTQSGKLFFDDFGDWVSDEWLESTGSNARIGNFLGDFDLDPCLNVTQGYASAELTSGGSGVQDLIADCLLRVSTNYGDEVKLVLADSSGAVVAGIRVYHNLLYIWGGIWISTNHGFGPETRRITIHVHPGVPSTAQVYMDGDLVGTTNVDVTAIKRIKLEICNPGGYALLDNVKVFKDWVVLVSGLKAGQIVELYASSGAMISRKKAAGTSLSINIDSVSCSYLPYANLVVRNNTGTTEILDAYREVWGGDSYSFTEHLFIKNALPERTSTLDSVTTTVLHDSDPIEWGWPPRHTGNEPFAWQTDPDFTLRVGNDRYHLGMPSGLQSYHGYIPNATEYEPSSPVFEESDYFVQEVYIPPTNPPQEIGLRFHYQYLDNGQFRSGNSSLAYWGANVSKAVGFNKVRMGDMPLPGRWSLLVVKAEDVGWGIGLPAWAKRIRGVNFTHFGGSVFWDRSGVVSASSYFEIFVDNLPVDGSVELRKADGTLVTTDDSYSYTRGHLQPYNNGMTVWPFAGYIDIFNHNGVLQYESPLMMGLFPRTLLTFDRSLSPFYCNVTAPSSFSKLPTGTMQFLDSEQTKSMEMYWKYGVLSGGQWQKTWQVNETKTRNGTGWLFTSYSYDSYGNVAKVRDPTGAILNYSYTNSGTNLASSWIDVSGQCVKQQYAYYSNGLLKNETDALGHVTSYEYDSIGRTTKVTRPAIGGALVSVRYVYDDANLTETYFDENGTKRVTWYDQYGRVDTIARYDSSGPYSWRYYVYAWNDKVETAADTDTTMSFRYDYLGRPTQVWNPDNSCQTTVYDDANNTVMAYDEMSRRTDNVFDCSDRLVQSIQYAGGVKLYSNMTYDAVGNLLSVSDPEGRVTILQYDNLARATSVKMPGNTYENYTYDSASRLKTKTQPDGTVITMRYDIAGRLINETVNSTCWKSYRYDANGNLLESKFKRDSTMTVKVARDYDAWNRVTKETTSIGFDTYLLKYTYDNRSNLKSMDVLGKWQLEYDYDELNRLQNVSSGTTVFGAIEYNTRDQPTQVAYGNGAVTTITKGEYRGWTDRITTTLNGQTQLDLVYSHDYSGYVSGVNGHRTYVYDTSGKVKYANDTSAYGTTSWIYGRSGDAKYYNWKTKNTSYTYDVAGHLIRLQNSTSQINYWYDKAGRLSIKNDGLTNLTYTYDAFDQLIQVNRGAQVKEKYYYDASGRMVRSVQGTWTETTIYAGSQPAYVKLQKNEYLHVYANGQHVAKRWGTSNFDDYYYHEDALGSVRLVSNNLQIAFNTDYLPFGSSYGSSGTGEFGFVDERTSTYSAVIQMGARFYDPLVGRFLTPDSVLGSLSNPTTLNRYAYCWNDPINKKDTSGHWGFFEWLGKSVVDPCADFIGDVGEALADGVVTFAEGVAATGKALLDAGEKFIDDVKEACLDLGQLAISGLVAIKEAWDSLDAGLKQWIINGIAMAVSFIPIVGPLLSCVIDGTIVEMWDAIKSGNWAALGMCALAFVPGVGSAGKLSKIGLKSFEKVGFKSVGNAASKFKPYKVLCKEASKEGKEAHHLLEKRLAERLGISDPGTIPSIALTRGEHQKITKALRSEIAYGTDYSQLSNKQIRNAYANVYGENSDWFKAIEHYFG